MPANIIFGTDSRGTGRIATIGIGAIVAILGVAAVLLFLSLPDANAFNARVERIFVENSDLISGEKIRLLEILAQSGTAFSEVLTSYRIIIFILLVFATAMLIAALVFLLMIVGLNRRMTEIERAGIQVSSLLISREERTVYLNNMEFALTEAAIETLSVLAPDRDLPDQDVRKNSPTDREDGAALIGAARPSIQSPPGSATDRHLGCGQRRKLEFRIDAGRAQTCEPSVAGSVC